MPYDAKKVAGQKVEITSTVGLNNPQAEFAIAHVKGVNVILFRDIDGKFATTTNGAIVKKSNGELLPDDEPLFLVRARDNKAILLLDHYRKLCNEDINSGWQVAKMAEIIQEFIDFSNEHPERMKQPGITKGL